MQGVNKIKVYFFFLLVGVIAGCNNISKKVEGYNVNTFEYVDLSIFDGWTNYYSLKLFNDGNMYVNSYQHRKGNIYYKVILGSTELDSVSWFVSLLLKSPVDTLYSGLCQDCSSYNFIVKTNNKKVKSLVQGVDRLDLETKDMNGLVNFLQKIVIQERYSIDSIFNFESKTASFFPPPPPPNLDTLINK